MLRQLHLLTIPTAISIAFFDATFFAIAHVFGFSGREILLGVVAGAAGGMYVFVAVLWQGAKNVAGGRSAATAVDLANFNH
ncbi:MAG TPA: hypothetical protein VMF12_04080 [Xanthobacteraceae bacterium]|nr:hypothetical protein [Xanthobacteraceae bacterium]